MNILIIAIAVIMLPIAICYFIVNRLSIKDNPKFFEFFVKKYEKKDKVKFPPTGIIVFTGSSVMKFWKTIENDLALLPVINRGIAGIKIKELAYFVDRIVIPYKPKAVVLYAGSNDIQGSKPRTPQEVLDGYKDFVRRVHSTLPDVPIYFISITPTPAKTRWKNWPAINEANGMIKAFSETDRRLRFIDTTEKFLDSRGQPLLELFKRDKIHLNEKGYAVWTSVIKPALSSEGN